MESTVLPILYWLPELLRLYHFAGLYGGQLRAAGMMATNGHASY